MWAPASYYLESSVFEKMLLGEGFKATSFDDIIKFNKDVLRDDRLIIDLEDLIFTLHCLSFWNVDDLPLIVKFSLAENLFEDYDKLLDGIVSSDIIRKVKDSIRKNFIIRKTIACGNYHSIAINDNDYLIGWGWCNLKNYDIIEGGPFYHLSCGEDHSAAINYNNEIVSWKNDTGVMLDVPSGEFFQVECGGNFSIAINKEDELIGWKTRDCSFADNVIRNIPSGKFHQVSCGTIFAVAIRGGDEDNAGELVAWPERANGFGEIDVPAGKFLQVACGDNFAIAIRAYDENGKGGELVAWGRNTHGQTDIPSGKFLQIACGGYIACGIRALDENKKEEEFVSWGLGGDNVIKETPGRKFAKIACGLVHAIAVEKVTEGYRWETGVIFSSGSGISGQFDNTPEDGILFL